VPHPAWSVQLVAQGTMLHRGPPAALSVDCAHQDVDGVLLVVDSSRPEQAKELEQYYTGFVQSNNLTTRQCMVLGVNLSGGTSLSNWTGRRLARRLRKRVVIARM
jgi:hypothetical protein